MHSFLSWAFFSPIPHPTPPPVAIPVPFSPSPGPELGCPLLFKPQANAPSLLLGEMLQVKSAKACDWS